MSSSSRLAVINSSSQFDINNLSSQNTTINSGGGSIGLGGAVGTKIVNVTGGLSIVDTTVSTSDITGALVSAGAIAISLTTDAISATNGGALTIGGGAAFAKSVWVGTTLTATTLTGTLSTAAQTNVTSLGTLTSLSSSGAVTFTSTTDATSSTAGGVLTVSGGGAFAKSVYVGTTLTATTLAGTLSTASQPNVTSLGTLTSLSSSGAVTFTSTTDATSSTAGGVLTVSGGGAFAKSVYVGTTLTATTLAGTLSTASQPNVTSLGTLTSLTSSGAVTFTSTTDATSSTAGGVLTISGGLAVAKSAYIGNTLTATTLAGTLSTASQPNVTSLGTLTSLTVSGTITASGTTASTSPTTGIFLVSGGIGISNATDAISNTNGGALTIAGGIAIGKSAYIGTNMVIAGNLTVNGTTTVTNTNSINITNNTIILNSAPAGSGFDSGILTQRYQVDNSGSTGDVVSDTPKVTFTLSAASSTTITLPGTASNVTGFYNNWWINITSGTATGQVRQITAYNGSTFVATLDNAFSTTPSAGDSVSLYDKEYSVFIWQASTKRFITAFTSTNIIGGDLTIIDYADLQSNNIISVSTTSSTSSTTGALTLSGGIGISLTTDAVSATNGGTLTSAGGAAFAKSVFVGTTLTATTLAGTLSTAAQPNVTSVGTLTSLTVSGAISSTGTTASTSNSTGIFTTSGGIGISNATDATSSTNGGTLTSAGGAAFAKSVFVGTTLTATTLAGTLSTAAQPNVTSVGTLTSLTVSGAISSTGTTASTSNSTGIFTTSGGIGISNTTDATSSTNGGTLTSAGGAAFAKSVFVGTTLTATTLAGTLSTAAQTNITSVGTLTGLTVSGAVNFTSTTDATSSTAGGVLTVSGGGAFAKSVYVGTTLTAVTLVGTLSTAAQTNITSVGTLTNLTVSGAISSTGTTASTSSTTGIFTTSGGIGINLTTDAVSSTNGGTLTSAGGAAFAKSVYVGTTLTATSLAGTITTVAQPNITSVGTLSSLTVSGAVNFTGTTDATSSTAGGTLTVSGGGAFAKSLYVGTSINAGNEVITGGTGIAINVTTSNTTTNASPLQMLSASLNTSQSSQMYLGVAQSNYNTAIIQFNYNAVGSATANSLGLGFFGDNNLLQVFTSGKITTSPTNYSGTPSTTGALSVFGGSTFTDNATAASGTTASMVFNSFSQPTLAASNTSVTTTNAATVYISGGPLTGTNETITNSYGLWNVGKTRVDDILNSTLATASTSNTTGAALFSGGIGISNTTDATSATNGGTLTSGGGAAFAKSVFVGTTLTATTLAGTLSTAAQPNITSVGTLTGLTITSASAGPLLSVSSNATTTADQIASFITPNLTAGSGNYSYLLLGVANSTNNAAVLKFVYNANGSNTNYFSIVSPNVGEMANFNYTGQLSIPTSITSTSSTSGSIVTPGGIASSNTTDATSTTNGGSGTFGGGLAVAKTAYIGTSVITPLSYNSHTSFSLLSGTTSATYKIANMPSGGGQYSVKFYVVFTGGKHSMTEIEVTGTYQEEISPPTVNIKKSSWNGNATTDNLFDFIVSLSNNTLDYKSEFFLTFSAINSNVTVDIYLAYNYGPAVIQLLTPAVTGFSAGYVQYTYSIPYNTAWSINNGNNSILLGVDGTLNLSGVSTFSNTTATTSGTTGSITTPGGISSSNTTAATNSTNGGSGTFDGGLAVAKNAIIGSTLAVNYGGGYAFGEQLSVSPAVTGNECSIGIFNGAANTGTYWAIGSTIASAGTANFSIYSSNLTKNLLVIDQSTGLTTISNGLSSTTGSFTSTAAGPVLSLDTTANSTNSILDINCSNTTVNSSVMSLLAGSLNTGLSVSYYLGVAQSTYNCGIMEFAYNANGTNANSLGFGFYGSGTPFIMNATGQYTISPTNYSGTPSTGGAYFAVSNSTFTDNSTASSGTAPIMTFNSFAQPTLAASNTGVTTTNAATVYIAGAPITGTNQTIGSGYGLWNVGRTRVDDVFNSVLTTASTSSTAAAVTLAGGISTTNTTDATSVTNGGTFTTPGGAAIGKTLYLGGNLNGNQRASTNTTFSAVSSVNITIDLSTYQYVEILIRSNISTSGANVTLQYNSGTNFSEFLSQFIELNQTISYDSTNIICKSAESAGNSTNQMIIIKLFQAQGSTRYSMTAEGNYTWAGVGQTKSNCFAYSSLSVPTNITLGVSTGTISGSYTILRNYV